MTTLDEIVASAHQSPGLRALGGHEVLDELRVMIRDRKVPPPTFAFPPSSGRDSTSCGSLVRPTLWSWTTAAAV